MTTTENDSDMEAVEDEGLLTRWSRRKHEANGVSVKQVAATETPVDPVEHEGTEENLPEDSDMPALETLNEESDYSGFMSPKVSDGLRTLALRQLFRGSMFSVRDGLDDYDDDFTQFAKLGDVVTAEMRRQMERLKAASEGDQDGVIETIESSSSEEGSELPVNTLSSDTAGSAVDESIIENEQMTENEQITEKDGSGEKLYASKNR